MLAQNFLNHNELSITELQREALIKVLVLLETGKLVHKQLSYEHDFHNDIPEAADFTGHFNMSHWCTSSISPHGTCNTICCIGGTAELVGKVGFGMGNIATPSLDDLFYPHGYGVDFESITPQQAARALRNYLTRGDAHWREVLYG